MKKIENDIAACLLPITLILGEIQLEWTNSNFGGAFILLILLLIVKFKYYLERPFLGLVTSLTLVFITQSWMEYVNLVIGFDRLISSLLLLVGVVSTIIFIGSLCFFQSGRNV